MTEDLMIFRTLLEKSCDANRLREMVGFAARRLMELEIEDPDGAPPMVLVIRIGSINSYRDRIGTRVPARSSAAYSEGSYFPGFLGAAAHGPGRRLPPSSGGLRPERVSTRSVDKQVQAMGWVPPTNFNPSLIAAASASPSPSTTFHTEVWLYSACSNTSV